MKIYRRNDLIPDGEDIHISSDRHRLMEPPHSHDFIEIVYITEGSAEETVNHDTYRVCRGDLIFINYGSIHAFSSEEGFSYINICFHPELLERNAATEENAFALLQLTAFDEIRRESDDGMVTFRGEERDSIEAILAAMLREYREERRSRRLVLESYMNILIVAILRRLTDADRAPALDGVWQELSDYIDANPEADLTLPALAAKCFYNPSYFSRAFKKNFHMSLTEYLNRKKIDRAIALLRRGGITDEALAEAVGFSSKSTLLRAFRRVTGKSLSDFKKELI